MALALGFPKERIIYTANNMTDEEFEEVLATGVLMNIGSLSRLEKIAEKHPGMRLCLRFNPDVCDGDNVKTMTGGDLTKFGILLEAVEEVKQIVRRGNLKVVGLHEHTGSGLQRCESVYRSMENLMAIAVPENFPGSRISRFGGGFKVPYQARMRRASTTLRWALKSRVSSKRSRAATGAGSICCSNRANTFSPKPACC